LNASPEACIGCNVTFLCSIFFDGLKLFVVYQTRE
jgi:hypothetical protein